MRPRAHPKTMKKAGARRAERGSLACWTSRGSSHAAPSDAFFVTVPSGRALFEEQDTSASSSFGPMPVCPAVLAWSRRSGLVSRPSQPSDRRSPENAAGRPAVGPQSRSGDRAWTRRVSGILLSAAAVCACLRRPIVLALRTSAGVKPSALPTSQSSPYGEFGGDARTMLPGLSRGETVPLH